jgi:hypothetical protein
MRLQHLLTATAFGFVAFAAAGAQGLDLTVNDVGIAIGNKPLSSVQRSTGGFFGGIVRISVPERPGNDGPSGNIGAT